jgi:hypothetical protein
VLGACVVIAVLMLLSVGLTIVEARRTTPLAFHCTRCGADFMHPPHHDFPRECPRCHDRDWANAR